MSKLIDLTGQKFGKWLVLFHVGRDKGRSAYFMCQCECGRIDIVSGRNLRRGSSTQCVDCKNNAQRVPHEFIDGIEHKYCTHCKTWRPLEYFHKGTTWDGVDDRCTFCKGYEGAMSRHGGDLTLEEHRAIRCQPCVITGIVNPLTISVDRIDSSLPYTLDNVQPMWSPLNLYKKDKDDAEFKAKIAPDIELIRSGHA